MDRHTRHCIHDFQDMQLSEQFEVHKWKLNDSEGIVLMRENPYACPYRLPADEEWVSRCSVVYPFPPPVKNIPIYHPFLYKVRIHPNGNFMMHHRLSLTLKEWEVYREQLDPTPPPPIRTIDVKGVWLKNFDQLFNYLINLGEDELFDEGLVAGLIKGKDEFRSKASFHVDIPTYSRACAMNADILAVLQQREAIQQHADHEQFVITLFNCLQHFTLFHFGNRIADQCSFEDDFVAFFNARFAPNATLSDNTIDVIAYIDNNFHCESIPFDAKRRCFEMSATVNVLMKLPGLLLEDDEELDEQHIRQCLTDIAYYKLVCPFNTFKFWFDTCKGAITKEDYQMHIIKASTDSMSSYLVILKHFFRKALADQFKFHRYTWRLPFKVQNNVVVALTNYHEKEDSGSFEMLYNVGTWKDLITRCLQMYGSAYDKDWAGSQFAHNISAKTIGITFSKLLNNVDNHADEVYREFAPWLIEQIKQYHDNVRVNGNNTFAPFVASAAPITFNIAPMPKTSTKRAYVRNHMTLDRREAAKAAAAAAATNEPSEHSSIDRLSVVGMLLWV